MLQKQPIGKRCGGLVTVGLTIAGWTGASARAVQSAAQARLLTVITVAFSLTSMTTIWWEAATAIAIVTIVAVVVVVVVVVHRNPGPGLLNPFCPRTTHSTCHTSQSDAPK